MPSLFGHSRRALVAAAAALAAAPVTSAKKKKRRKRNKKVTRNAFGCVDVGRFCQRNDQCCSGICEGKKDKKKCRAHDTGDCQAGQDNCAGTIVPCITATGDAGSCARTTGNAGYCVVVAFDFCAACTRDTDCQAMCGPQAACIVCESECEPNGTGCVGPSGVSC
jgi:hypothetical protein